MIYITWRECENVIQQIGDLSSSDIVSTPLLLLERMNPHWLCLCRNDLFAGILNTSRGGFHLPVQ